MKERTLVERFRYSRPRFRITWTMLREFSTRIFQMTDRNSASWSSPVSSPWKIFIFLTIVNASASDPGAPVESIQSAHTTAEIAKGNTHRSRGCHAVEIAYGASTLPVADGRSHRNGLLPAAQLVFPPVVVSRMRWYP